MYRQKATYNDGMASRLRPRRPGCQVPRGRAAGGAPGAPERSYASGRRPHGEARGHLRELELTGLMKPFDLEVWYGERVAVLGSNGSGKSHFLRLLAAGGSDPDSEHEPVGDVVAAPVAHTGVARLGSRVRPGWFAQTHEHPGAARAHAARGPAPRRRAPTRQAARGGGAGARPLRAGPRRRSRPSSRSRAVSRRGSRSCCSSCPAPPCCCSTSRPTTWTSTPPRRWRRASTPSRGPCVAVTHDRWFAREFDRYLVFGADGRVYESTEPVWDEGRVARAR